jgi:hypothetical protein
MESEDVVHVLRRFREVLLPDGLMLDLQVIRPHPVVEVDGAVACEIDGSPLRDGGRGGCGGRRDGQRRSARGGGGLRP